MVIVFGVIQFFLLTFLAALVYPGARAHGCVGNGYGMNKVYQSMHVIVTLVSVSAVLLLCFS